MSCKKKQSVRNCSVHSAVSLKSNNKSEDTSLSQCAHCHCSLVSDDVVEHSFECQLLPGNCRIQAPTSSHYHKTHSSVQAIHSNSQHHHHTQLQMHQRHLNFNSLQWTLFGSTLLLLTIFSSLFTISFAHKTLPWDSQSIEDVATGGISPSLESTVVPDLVAIAGHLFQYQILSDTFDPRAVHYQVQEVGRNELPKWLSFNQTSATFRGVPLLQDQGKLYITLHVYSAARGGSIVVAESLFSITIVTSKAAVVSDKFPVKSVLLPDWYNGTNCLPNYQLFKEEVSRYPHCSGDELPVIASVVTVQDLNKMSGFARADLFSATSEMIGICPHLLVVDSVDWSSREGMKLWRQLTESGHTKYLDSTTILSFQLSCGAIDESIASVLSHLDEYIASQCDKMSSNERGTSLIFLYLHWFVSQGSEVLLTSAPASEEVHHRLRRQNINSFEDPVIENVFTATVPSSSAVTSPTATPLSSSETIIVGETAVYATVNSSPSRITSVHTSTSAVSKMTQIEIFSITSPHPIPHPSLIESHVQVTTSSSRMTDDHMTSTDISSSVVSTTTLTANLQNISDVTSPHPTPSQSREQVKTSTMDDRTITPDISSLVVPSMTRSQITLSSSLPMNDDMANVDLTQTYDSTIEPSMPQSTNVGTLPSILPSSRAIPAPTLVDFTIQISTDSSIESSQILSTASDGANSITPSSRVIPSSEPTLVVKPSSLLSTTLAPLASMDSPSVPPTRSVSVLDHLETVQPLLSSIPESVLQTTSVLPSHTFTIAPLASVDSLSISPIRSVLGTSIPALSAMLSVQSSVPVLTSSVLPSWSFTIRSSIEDLPSSTIPLSVVSPSTTLRSVFVTELPTVSPPDASTRILETSTLILPTPSQSFRPTTSDVEPTTSSIFSLTSILTSALFSSGIQSSLDVLLPETTTSIFIEPTPTPSISSISSEVPQQSTSMIAVPDTTVISSSDLLTSSNNMLMPMSTSELTVSLSIFTPSPLPSLVFVSSSMVMFPTSTQLPILTTTNLSLSPSASVVSSLASSMAILSSSTLSFTSEIMSSAVPSTSLLGTSALVADPTVTPGFSMSVSTISPSLLMPMPSSEITASLSIFTPSPSSSVIDVQTSQTILPDTTQLFPTMTPTIDSPSQSSSHIISVAVSTSTLLSSTPDINPTTLDTFSTPQVMLPSVISTLTLSSEVATFLLESSPFTTATSFVFSSPEFATTTSSFLSSYFTLTSTLPTLAQTSMILSIQSSMAPSTMLISSPTMILSMAPSTMVISSPTTIPSMAPSTMVISSPTTIPSMAPSTMVISSPTMIPSMAPSTMVMSSPTMIQSMAPSTMVISSPTMIPSMVPSTISSPTMIQSMAPSTMMQSSMTPFTMVQSSMTSSTTIQTMTPSTMVQVSMTSPPSMAPSTVVQSSPTTIPSSVMLSTVTQPTMQLTMTSSTMTQMSTQSSMTSATLTSVIPSTPIPQPPSTITPHVTPTATSMPKVNLLPLLLNPIGTLIVNVGQLFQFSIPENTFYDPESGTTSFLLLTLLNYRGEPLSNTTWIQVQQNRLEGLPLASQITNEAITDHLFILQAQDEVGSSAHDFVTIRILYSNTQGPFFSFLTILFENEFTELNQNLKQRISLVERLSSSSIASSLKKRQIQHSAQIYNTEEIFVNEIFDESGLGVSYRNLSIPDSNCAEFYDWIANIFNFTSNEFTDRFLEAMAPEFTPTLNPAPRIEGICRAVSSNIPPTLSEDIHRVGSKISEKVIFLSTIIPAACVAFCCLLFGVCALCIYRRRRSERKYLTSKRLYLNRNPVILTGEIDLPDRRRRPVIFENEAAPLHDETLQEERDELSDTASDDYIPPPGDQDRLLHEPHKPPPNYRLPLLYRNENFHDS